MRSRYELSIRLLFVALVGLFVLGAPLSATALDLEIGIGAKGGGTGMGATEVPEEPTYPCENRTCTTDPELYGLFGPGLAGGPVLEIKLAKAVGIETGYYFANDSTEGTNDITNEADQKIGEITQIQTTSAHHIPLLLKGSPPFDRVRPFLGLGLEFVMQKSSSLEYEGENVTQGTIDARANRNSVRPSNYTLFQVTAGVEIDAGPVRVPIELRAGYNLGWDDGFDKRVKVDQANDGLVGNEKFVYDGEYIGHFGLFAGILYRWDVAL